MGDLFLSGNSFLSYPLRIVWKIFEDLPFESPAQAGFSVPKRTFKRAVDRNLLKRRIRESYRLHKQELYGSLNDSSCRMALMLIYIAKEELPFDKIEPAVIKAIGRLDGELKKQ
jgi:ribonuclease P protein component